MILKKVIYLQTKTSSKGGVLEDVYTKFYLEDTYPLNKWPSMAGQVPVSGVWKVDGFPTTTAPIAKGNTMPPYCGKAVTWRLIQYA